MIKLNYVLILFWPLNVVQSLDCYHDGISRRRLVWLVSSASASVVLPPTLVQASTEDVAVPSFPFEERNRQMNKGAVIRDDYWYLTGRNPPRRLDAPLRGDDPQWNAFGSCSSAVDGGNSCTYVSLSQRVPAYSKYAFAISDGANEFRKLGELLRMLVQNPAAGDTVWDEAASYVTRIVNGYPPSIIDAELKMVLFATALTTSPNFPGPSRELLVARYYVNETRYASEQIAVAIQRRDAIKALQAWEFGRDSWNSYFKIVNRSIVPKMGDKFQYVT